MSKGNFALFIPLQGCPGHCIYCDQRTISGQMEMSPEMAGDILRTQMPTWRKNNISGQIAFFGGTFTGLPLDRMKQYLAAAQPYIADGSVDGIRISTRPDRIDEDILSVLKAYNVTHIELGVQSMDDDVLCRSGRGYTVHRVENSAGLIKRYGFTLGMQMMPGLPGDTPEKSLETARRIVECGAEETRIYPTVVLRHTPLEKLLQRGEYAPMSLETAIDLCAGLRSYFEQHQITVLKVGLHSGAVESGIVAGPFHPAFGQLVSSRLCLEKLRCFCRENALHNQPLTVIAKHYSVSDILGQHRSNAATLEKEFGIILKISKNVLTNGEICIIL